ncbi:MFS general substrate transporter [Clavulina sp. PMI_390]|nr:MFS general substrate transporter [Clavulina sp. PMI_390]
MPASGGLSNIFGRRAVMMVSIALFAIGAAIAGSAQSMNTLIVGRAIQGAGGGSIISMSEIIVADLVPLRERGNFAGIIGAVWALASVLGPPIGGALASAGQWRWLFYLNLPLSAVAAVLVFTFLRMKTPEGSATEKLRQIDWIGNLAIIGSTASIILALTWGGVQYSWTAPHVIIPLILGGVGIAAFLVYEFTIAKHPIVPMRLFGNRTSLSGYAIVFFHGVAMTLVVYYLPTYFQGAKGASAIRSGILLFPTAIMIAPVAIITGQTVERTGHYLIQNYIGTALMMLGYGTMSILTANSTIAMGEGLQIIGAIGLGILYVGPNFAILAPLAVEDNAHALALMSYIRTFGQTFGVTIGTTVLQNGLKSRLPEAFLEQFPDSTSISYAIIPLINSLTEPTRSLVQQAFAGSIRNIWFWVVGIAGIALVSALPMQQLTLATTLDENWGLEKREAASDIESRAVTPVEKTA